MERKSTGLLLALICSVFVFGALPILPSMAAAPIVLKYGGTSPGDSWPEVYANKLWRADIKKATEGRVTFEEYYAQTLVRTPDTWRSVQAGIADTTAATHGALPGLCPLAEVVTLPGLPFKSSTQASGILWKLYEEFPSIRDEFKAQHVTHFVVGIQDHIISRKKNFKTIDDFKGEKIRATGGSLAPEQLKLLGAVPVSMPVTEVYLNLQKGVMDAAVSNWDMTVFTKLYEVGKYYTFVPLSAIFISNLINKAKWDSFPKDIQQIMDKQGGLWRSEEQGYAEFDSAHERAKEMFKSQGLETVDYTVPQAEMQKWISVASRPLWDKWVKEGTSKGHPEAQQILNRVLELIDTYKPAYKPGYKP
jgi:TRAP-type C4-dicarboxylate transport system substrate-binding protein